MFVPTRRLAAGALAAGVLLTGAACSSSKPAGIPSGGGGNADPIALVRNAGATLKTASAAQYKIHVLTDSATETKLGVPSAQQPLLQNGFLGISSRNQGRESAFVLSDGTDKLIDLRVNSDKLYVGANLTKLEGLSGKSSSNLGSLGSNPYVQALAAGKFIQIDLAQVRGLFAQYGSLLGATASPGQQPNPGALLHLDRLEALVSKDFHATQQGSDPQLGDHYVLTGNARALAQDLVAYSNSLESSIPGRTPKTLSPSDLASIPDKNFTLDVYAQGSKVTRFSVDLIQFMDPAEALLVRGGQVALAVDLLNQADDTSAPSGSVPLDLTKLAGGTGG